MTTWVSGLLLLDKLNLDDVDLSGVQNIHRLLYMIPSLLELSLSGCSLSNANFVPYLNSSIKLANIEHLDLSSNNLQDDLLPRFLQNMTSLAFLDLSGYNLSQAWNSENMLNMIPSVSELHLSECSIPKALGKLRSLQVLVLSYNHLTGPISEALGNLRSLQVLELSSNYLSGPIPKFHGKLTKLRLSYNQLNGTIPDSLGRSIYLTELLLQSNWLTSHISLTLGKLTSLQVFSLSSNLLNGTILVSFGQLTKLYFLDASNNSLQGVVSEA
ncbi:leucine-rich repeat protein [Tanacetum coccineum]